MDYNPGFKVAWWLQPSVWGLSAAAREGLGLLGGCGRESRAEPRLFVLPGREPPDDVKHRLVRKCTDLFCDICDTRVLATACRTIWRRPLAAKAIKSFALAAQIEFASNTRGGARTRNLLLSLVHWATRASDTQTAKQGNIRLFAHGGCAFISSR